MILNNITFGKKFSQMFFRKKSAKIPSHTYGLDATTHKGFDNLYDLYARNMYALVLHKTGDEELGREIVQNIFKRLWERRETIQLKGSWENYLIRAVKYEVIDYYRSKDRQKLHVDISEEHVHSENDIENLIFSRELQKQVIDLIDQLPNQCRRVFKMSREKGYTNKEIANELQISIRAVEFHITKALAFLRQNLADEYNLPF